MAAQLSYPVQKRTREASMVQEIQGRKHIALFAALMLAAGVAQADVITGAGPGAGSEKSVKSGGNGKQKGGVSVAAGDITGDGRADVRKQPIAPIAPIKPIARPIKPETPIARSPVTPKPLPNPPGNIKTKPEKPQAMLVPAVQKIREVAPRSK
jgi:hypothetical protein